MSNWERTTLEKLGDIKKYGKIEFSAFGRLVNFVTPSLVGSSLYVESLEKYLNKDIVSKPLPANSVILKTNGKKIFSFLLKKPSYLFTTLAGFVSFSKVSDPLFIKYGFDFSIIRKWYEKELFDKLKKNDSVNLEISQRVPFCKPPYIIQRKIGEIIVNYDLLLENFKKQIELLKTCVIRGSKDISHLMWFLQKKIEILGRIKAELIEAIYSQTLEINLV